jgi:hypothetical protein
MDIKVIAQKGSHMLIARGDKRAIVEQRNNHLYNCHGVARAGIPAGQLASIDQVIDEADWVDEDAGRAMFHEITSRGTDLAEHMR